jgi:hypothetical protein
MVLGTAIFLIFVVSNWNHFEGIMPEGCINKMANLQETEFLRLFGLTNVHY